jgi:hypothetical protein
VQIGGMEEAKIHPRASTALRVAPPVNSASVGSRSASVAGGQSGWTSAV